MEEENIKEQLSKPLQKKPNKTLESILKKTTDTTKLLTYIAGYALLLPTAIPMMIGYALHERFLGGPKFINTQQGRDDSKYR